LGNKENEDGGIVSLRRYPSPLEDPNGVSRVRAATVKFVSFLCIKIKMERKIYSKMLPTRESERWDAREEIGQWRS